MSTYSLGTGPDVIVGTSGDDTVNGTSSTLNASDRLDGGAGHDTLQLFGGGSYDLSSLAQFTNFEEVDLTNVTGGQSNLTLANGSDLTVNIDNENSSGGSIQLASGTVTVNLSAATYYYEVLASTGDTTVNLGTYDYVFVSSGRITVDASQIPNGYGGYVYLDPGTVNYGDVLTGGLAGRNTIMCKIREN